LLHHNLALSHLARLFLLFMPPRPPGSTLFPYTTLFRSRSEYIEVIRAILKRDRPVTHEGEFFPLPYPGGLELGKPLKSTVHPLRDRKSTRLNSSHLVISYAVFCLKKKTIQKTRSRGSQT